MVNASPPAERAALSSRRLRLAPSPQIFTCFCRASTIRLGPLVVRDPVFMEMNVGGLVRGLDEGIIGIAG